MNIRKTLAALALACAALVGATASAGSLTYSDGDLFLGFRATAGTGSSQEYLVKLGGASTFTAATASTAVSLGNIGTDLSATFGSNWASRGDLNWGIIGANGSTNVLYASKPQATAGKLNNSGHPVNIVSQQAIAAGKIATLGQYYVGFPSANSSTANSAVALLRGQSVANSWTSYLRNGSTRSNDFSFFSSPIEGNFGAGATAATLEVYQLTPAASVGTAGADSTLIGLVKISTTGAVTFSPISRTGTAAVNSGNSTLDLTVAPTTVDEGGNVVVTVVRGGNASQAVTVDLTTAGTGLASFGTSSLSFAANDTQKIVTLTTVATGTADADREFTVTLANASAGASIAGSPVTVTVKDVNQAPIGFEQATYTYNSKNSSGVDVATFTFKVSRANGVGTDSATLNALTTFTPTGFAKLVSPTNYTLSPVAGAISFAAGETSKTFTITLPSTAGVTTLPATGGEARFTLTGVTGPTGGTLATAVQIKAKDIAKPVIVVTTTPSTATVNSPAISISGTIKDNSAPDALQSFSVALNGTVLSSTIPVLTTPTATTAFGPISANLENGPNTITVTAKDSSGNEITVSKAVTLVNSSLAASVGGTYEGVIAPATGVAPTNENTGYFTATVSAVSGAFSGRVSLSGVNVAFSGLILNNGDARFNIAGGTPATAFPVIDRTEFESFLGALKFNANGTTISGSIDESATSTTNLATLSAAKVTTTATVAAFTAALAPSTQSAPYSTTGYPLGYSPLTIRRTAGAAVSVTGFLADGTTVSSVGKVRADGKAVIYASLYRKQGSLTGLVDLTAITADTDLTVDATWFRPALSRAQYYPSGFAVNFDGFGAALLSPSAQFAFFNSAANTVANADLTFGTTGALAGLAAAQTYNPNVLETTGVGRVLPIGSTNYTFAVAPAAGTFTGTFKSTFTTGVAGTQSAAYRGIVVNKGANQGGFGYFLNNPTLSTTVIDGASGQVTLTAQP